MTRMEIEDSYPSIVSFAQAGKAVVPSWCETLKFYKESFVKRIQLFGIPLIAAALVGSLACGGEEKKPDAIRVCKDPKTNQVVEDSRCGQTTSHAGGGANPFLWWYLGYTTGGYRPGSYIQGGSPTYTGSSRLGFASNASAISGGGWSSTGQSFGSRTSAGFGATGAANSAGAGA